ncbi:MAG: efflux RND transporter permease subunit [candidate division Zixibacteria bacterium]|nr:efflux RND transporter permease subunit [candidate division Zixibacteria bacterium]
MNIIKNAIQYPVTVTVGVLIAVLAGIMAITGVPIQLTPDVEQPFITVSTSWPGASPEEIEKEIIDKQEEYLKSVEGLVEMNSSSDDGQGSITLEFPVGTDITGAVVRVTNKLNEVPEYPENADRPVVTSSGQMENVIAWFTISATRDGVYVPHMFSLVDEIVKPRLERVTGVAAINVYGGLDEELHVTFDPELLASSGITINEVIAALRSENLDISGGDFGEGKRRYVVRTISRFESPDQVEKTVITVRNSIPIRIGDIADVSLAYKKPVAQVRHLGRPSMALNAQRQIGANVLEVTENLLEQVDNINREILEPRGLKMANVYNQKGYINSAIDLVFDNLYLGSALAVLVLFLFLRSASSILIIGLSIPISVITTFVTMSLMGRTINVISLAGMAFAVGMVVDASIVVLENIYRHMQMGKPRLQAAVDGTQEVWGAVLASTVTTVAVFLPVVFIEERAGQLFRDIAIAISSAIAISLVVSITVIPSASSRILKTSTKLTNGKTTRLDRFSAHIAHLVDYVNARWQRRLATIVGMIAVSMGLTWVMLPDAEYLPNGNENLIFGFILPPPGYNLDEMVGIAEDVEGRLSHLWETPADQAKDLPGGGLSNFFFVALNNQAFLGMASRDETRGRELLPVANEALQSIPGAFGIANQRSLFSGSFSGTRSVQIDITGPDLNKVLAIARQVFGQVGQILPGSSSRPIPGLDLGNPEVSVYPDRVRAADIGFSASQIGQQVNALVDGAIVSEYRHQGREIDLVLKGRDDWTRHTQDIEQLPLASPTGRVITLGDLATVQQKQGPVTINHVERQRAVSVLVQLGDNISLEDAIARIQEQIVAPLRDQNQIGGLYDIQLSGAADDLTKLRVALLENFHMAIILTYLLLAALFQSFTYPIVILVTVPLATFGGVLGLQAVRLVDPYQGLDVLTMLGFVILIGTVINNSILIVYQALQLMREGYDPRSAVKESVRVRVRPIFMSTATSVLGMAPLVIMPGAGSELYRGLGSVVLGGLALSSVFTLVLTPLVFAFSIEAVVRVKSLFGRHATAVSTTPAFEEESIR